MTLALAINIVAAIGGLAGLSSFLNIILSKKKVRAEAADIEQNISDKVLKNLDADNDKLRVERDVLKANVETIRATADDMRARMEKYEWDQYETRMLIIALINWARRAYDELLHNGSQIETPPTEDLLTKLKEKIQ